MKVDDIRIELTKLGYKGKLIGVLKEKLVEELIQLS